MKKIVPFLFLHLISIGILLICITGATRVDQGFYAVLAGVSIWPVIDTGWATLKEVKSFIEREFSI